MSIDDLPRVDVLGYPVVDAPVQRVATAACDALANAAPCSYVFLNPHSAVVADTDAEFRRAVRGASVVFCDGVGLELAGMLLRRRRIERIYGYEFFTAVSRELSRRRAGRVFFLGGRDEYMPALVAQYRTDHPGLEAVEWFAPPFRTSFSDEEIGAMAARVAAFRADVLWIGLGSPKQEKVLPLVLPASGARLGAAIGAVFDFYAGEVPHAPAWVRRAGLQWAHRLVLEPRRLWKRTFVSVPLFFGLLARAAFASHASRDINR